MKLKYSLKIIILIKRLDEDGQCIAFIPISIKHAICVEIDIACAGQRSVTAKKMEQILSLLHN